MLEGGGGTDCNQFFAIVRDFSEAHGDFETLQFDPSNPFDLFDSGQPRYDFDTGEAAWNEDPDDRYIDTVLDEAGNPRYLLGNEPSPDGTIQGLTNFRQWYSDVEGVNQRFIVPIPDQDPSEDRFLFDSEEFFPIDGEGFGNEGNGHNYHFTTEIIGNFV